MLEQFSKYYAFNNESIINKRTNKEVTFSITNKNAVVATMKTNEGKNKQVTKKKLLAAMGIKMTLPKDAKVLIMCGNGKEYFIRPNGEVYSFTSLNPQGLLLKHKLGSAGYPQVSLLYRGKRRNVEVHSLLAQAFIMENYLYAGLCVLHRDDNKLHCYVSNLSVGTYSQNNKDSYATGCNPGNGLKKKV